MQENWIGKSQGMRFAFELARPTAGMDRLEVFTTRPDTIFGASFTAVSPDHPIAAALAEQDEAVAEFIASAKGAAPPRAELETAEKKGYVRGLPFVIARSRMAAALYVANFVLMDYGTGAIFGVPAHDQRDFEFATKYGLPIRRVVAASDEEAASRSATRPRAGAA
jgi:leucyl-tRNA synthetase